MLQETWQLVVPIRPLGCRLRWRVASESRIPRWSPLTYAAAGLVAFSRMYLGDHYPGDVVSGSLAGVLFAMLFHSLLGGRRKREKKIT